MNTPTILLTYTAAMLTAALVKAGPNVNDTVTMPHHVAVPYHLHWQSSFSVEQQNKLQSWLKQTTTSTAAVVGPYPFTMQYYVYYRSNSKEPVPWAHTQREDSQQVHFYIDAGFPLDAFLNDWTAYHELSHLALPYVGRDNAWFAEGFASYMQYQIMQHAGLVNSAKQMISNKFTPQRHYYANQRSMLDNAVMQLQARHFAAGYWGGAQFFVVADTLMQQRGKGSFTQLIQRYQLCCRLQNDNISDVIKSWDELTNSTLFSDLLQQFRQQSADQFLLQYQL